MFIRAVAHALRKVPCLMRGWRAGLLSVLFCAAAVQAVSAVQITELLAENDGGLRDADGESPDWIELYNDSASPLNLAGWHLTDNATNLTKWTFPATNLPSGTFLIVFASGKDRAVAGVELHTSFRLDSAGGYLALVRPDGTTVEQAFTYPAQRANVSYGIASQVALTTLLNTGTTARVFVPSNGNLGLMWTARVFDDSLWLASNSPVGFLTGNVTNNILSFDVAERAQNPASFTQAGFQPLIVNSNVSSSAIQTQVTTRVFGGISVTISNNGVFGYDDRQRTSPVNSGSFTESLLLRDFIFSTSTNATGFDVHVTGLAPNVAHRITIWSFDSGSPGSRVSDWYANGVLVTNNYIFDGGTPVTNNAQYRFSFDSIANGVGTIAISGRRDASSSGVSVFLNALQVSTLTAVPPTNGLASLMFSNNATAYIRIPFNVANPSSFSALTLRMRYNDGFVAYLNGQMIASRNAPGSPAWNSAATAANSAMIIEDIPFVPAPGLLESGNNMLAIHALNVNPTNSDLVIAPQLIGQESAVLGERWFQPSTPGFVNSTGYLGLVADTKFSVNRGFYTAPFSLSLTSATAGAEIRFTTNGSPPSLTNGFVFSTPINITGQSFVRAAAFKSGLIPTDIDTHSYIFLRDVLRQSNNIPGYPATWQGSYPADYEMDSNVVKHLFYGQTLSNDLRSIPVLSIVTEFDGLWGPVRGIYNHATETHDLDAGRDWERAASVELILPEGTNGATGFAVNCGIRMHGNASRDNARTPKHNVRLVFNGEYGPTKLRYPWFPGEVEEFDNIIVRADGFVDAWPSRYSDTTAYIDGITGQSWLGQRYRPETATYLRDVFAKESQRDMGWTGSRSSWVHLYLNGLYWGLYNPIERLDASFMAQHLGGWDSDWDVIVGPDTGTAAIATDGSLTDWNALMGLLASGVNSESAYQAVSAIVDVDNVIDYFILHFFIEAEDWPHHNWYAAHRRANSTNGLPATKWQIFTWDQEVSLDRNVRRNRTGVNNADTPAYIYSQLRNWPEFRRQFGDRVHQHLFNNGALTPSNNVARFAALAAAITNAINGESARWGDAREFTIGTNPGTGQTFTRDEWWKVELQKLWTNFFQTLTADNVARFRAANLYPTLGAPSFSQFGGGVPAGYGLTMSHTNAGGVIRFTTDGTDPRVYGSGAAAGVLYTAPVIINTPTLVRARVLNAGSWSALVEAVFYPPQDLSRLHLTELMYHPPDVGVTNSDEFEFLELKNTGTNTLNLSGLTFEGINFTFTNGTLLEPGQFCVLARNATAFASKHPGVALRGIYTGRLDNGGEEIALLHPLGARVFGVTYDDTAPWPVTPDDFGFSLVPNNPGLSQAPDSGADWRASANPGGSPGADDPTPAIPAIVINEVLTASVPPDGDRIELFNPTLSAVNVGGWFLTDDPGVPTKFRLPNGTMIPALGYAVFGESQFNPTPGTNNSFSLSSRGDEVYLFSGDAATNLTGYSHGFSFEGSAAGVAFGRHVNSAGDEQFPAQLTMTFSNANSGPLVGPVVLNEIHYHPAPGGDEFVELKNITGNPVSCFDVSRPTNTWRIAGMDFTFSTNVTLPPGGLLVIAATNPAAFRAKYSVPTNVPVLGPFAGNLQDSGERLELRRPDVPDTNGLSYINVDVVRYNDRAPWPPSADGAGPSLQRRVASNYGDDPINWIAAVPTPGAELETADTDADGVPDLWELDHGTQPFIADGSDDPDLDGVSNLDEFLAGTDPQSAESYLHVEQVNWEGGGLGLQFIARAQRSYSVLYKATLAAPSWVKLTDVPAGLERVVTVTDTNAPPGQRFYRLVTPATAP